MIRESYERILEQKEISHQLRLENKNTSNLNIARIPKKNIKPTGAPKNKTTTIPRFSY